MLLRTTKVLLLLVVMSIGQANADDDACKTETEALEANTDVMAAFEKLANATEDVFIDRNDATSILQDGGPTEENLVDGCFLLSENKTISCKFDYQPYTAEAKSACEGAGGTFYEGEFKIVCENDNDRRSELRYLNDPICVGASCADEAAEEIYQDAISDLDEDLSEPTGTNCKAFFSDVDEDITSGADSMFVSLNPILLVMVTSAMGLLLSLM